jgi:hypothetical protein
MRVVAQSLRCSMRATVSWGNIMYVFAVQPSASNPHLDARVSEHRRRGALGACDAYANTEQRVLLQESVNVIKFQPPGPAGRLLHQNWFSTSAASNLPCCSLARRCTREMPWARRKTCQLLFNLSRTLCWCLTYFHNAELKRLVFIYTDCVVYWISILHRFSWYLVIA